MSFIAGVDIGGTKTAVSIARIDDDEATILTKERFATDENSHKVMEQVVDTLEALQAAIQPEQVSAIGISCGGPLDSRAGLILSPPNLPNWDRVDVVSPLAERFGVPVLLQNDANACALAEWQWGAGRGCENMIFLTFGTGMGAGIILDGKLYSGTNDMAGEVGHMRLAEDGPVGYGKAGSFEGFCSGGGIAQLARSMSELALRTGETPTFYSADEGFESITAESVGKAAQAGDPLALQIYRVVGERLGQGLAVLVDVLNPQRIVIGSIYGRQQTLLEPIMRAVLEKEALPLSLQVCQIVPAGLGEKVGDYAALSVAMQALR